MKRTLTIILVVLLLGFRVNANADTIDTYWSTPSGAIEYKGRGVMFNITAFDQGLVITGFDLNIPNPYQHNYKIYTAAGGYEGIETNSAAWGSAIYSGAVTSSGAGVPTHVDIQPFEINTNTTLGVYITGDAVVEYPVIGKLYKLVYYGNDPDNSPDLPHYFSNDDIALQFGAGFSEDKFQNPISERTWSGTVHYNLVPIPGSVWLLISGLVALVGFRRFSLRN